MRNPFNKAAGVFKSPTKKLHDELRRDVWSGKLDLSNPDRAQAIADAYPSLERVKKLIAKGADVNKFVGSSNALSILVRQYATAAEKVQGRSRIGLGDQWVTKKEWQACVNRLFDVGQALIDAGADPRVKYAYKGKDMGEDAAGQLTFHSNKASNLNVNKFRKLLTAKAAELEKQEEAARNAPRPAKKFRLNRSQP